MPNEKRLIDAIEKEKPYIPTEDYEVGYNNGLTMAQAIILATDINVGVKWISVKDRLPKNFVSVLGYMTDAGEFPPVRECYTVGNAFFFPALGDIHPVSHWCEIPKPPKGE